LGEQGTIWKMAFNIKTARESFPALKQPQVFFDNAGGSQTLGTVIDE
jgi:selenocysteine lyase/cysteine desulfurase